MLFYFKDKLRYEHEVETIGKLPQRAGRRPSLLRKPSMAAAKMSAPLVRAHRCLVVRLQSFAASCRGAASQATEWCCSVFWEAKEASTEHPIWHGCGGAQGSW